MKDIYNKIIEDLYDKKMKDLGNKTKEQLIKLEINFVSKDKLANKRELIEAKNPKELLKAFRRTVLKQMNASKSVVCTLNNRYINATELFNSYYLEDNTVNNCIIIDLKSVYELDFSEMVNLVIDIENNRFTLLKNLLNYDIPLAVSFILHQHRDKTHLMGYQDLKNYLENYQNGHAISENEFLLNKNTVIEVVTKEIAIQNENEYTGRCTDTNSIGAYKPLKGFDNWYYREL